MLSRLTIAFLAVYVSLGAARTSGAVSLDALWTGEARFQVEPIEIAGDVTRMHFISMFWDDVPGDPHFKAYYIDDGYTTGLARSYDGIRFTDMGTVLSTGPSGSYDDRMAAFSSVMKDEAGVYHLVYEAAGYSSAYPGDVAYATSTDGVHFTKHGIILPHDRSWGSFERVNNGTPSLHKEGDTWYLYYHGYEGANCQVGLATGTDIMALSRVSGNPIIPTSPNGWDSGTTGKRSRPIKQGDYWYMAVEGSTDPPYEKAKWTTGIVRSSDLIHWEKCPMGHVLPQTYSGMSFDGSDMIEIGDDTYIYYRGPGNNTYRARLVAEPFGREGIFIQDADITPDFRYVYELGTESMGDYARYQADVSASYNIKLTAVGDGDPAPHFYADMERTEAFLEFRFDFSRSSFRATRASIRDVLAMFKIVDHPQDTTAVTQWSTDQLTWHTLRELESPAWPGRPVGATSQGTRGIILAGERGLCEQLFYRVYFQADTPFGWNWNQWNRDSANQFRLACQVVPDDYVSIRQDDLLLGRDFGAVALVDEAVSYWVRADGNAGHVKITSADLDREFTVLLDFLGPPEEVDALIAELVSRPAGSEYLSASTTYPLLAQYGCKVALRFAPPEEGSFTFNWHFAGHPLVRVWEIRIVPEPGILVFCTCGALIVLIGVRSDENPFRRLSRCVPLRRESRRRRLGRRGREVGFRTGGTHGR